MAKYCGLVMCIIGYVYVITDTESQFLSPVFLLLHGGMLTLC